MKMKLMLLLAALASANPIRAGETGPDGHGKAGPGKASPPAESPRAEKPSEDREIKAAGKAEKCKPHHAAKSDCFICDATLRDKGRLWCREHARYEDRCFLCHPEIKDAKRLYCQEHGLYEDECFLCHPELKKPKTGAPASPGKGNGTPPKGANPKKG